MFSLVAAHVLVRNPLAFLFWKHYLITLPSRPTLIFFSFFMAKLTAQCLVGQYITRRFLNLFLKKTHF